MERQFLRPRHDALKIEGKITYKESTRAWSLMRLKKDLILEFPQLKERRSRFSYKMVLFRSYHLLQKELKEMEKKEEPLPLLLFFYKEPNNDEVS